MGTDPRARLKIEGLLPGLGGSRWEVTSDDDPSYNCVGWALGDAEHWWEPVRPMRWPEGVPREDTVEAYLAVFAIAGFTACDTADPEPGFEKVVIYGEQSGFTHAARQLPDGTWTSKLGALEDIEHDDPRSLEGSCFGRVVAFLRRPVAAVDPRSAST